MSKETDIFEEIHKIYKVVEAEHDKHILTILGFDLKKANSFLFLKYCNTCSKITENIIIPKAQVKDSVVNAGLLNKEMLYRAG